MFSSTTATIDDACEDFEKEVYEELIELYTSPADWIINMEIATGRVAIRYIIRMKILIENFHTVTVQKIQANYCN